MVVRGRRSRSEDADLVLTFFVALTLLNFAPDHAGEARYPDLDVLVRSVAEVEPEGIVTAAVREKRTSNHESDVGFDGLTEQFEGVELWRQVHPQEQAAFGAIPRKPRRKFLLHRRQHQVAFAAVQCLDGF